MVTRQLTLEFPESKRCSRCGGMFPATNDYFARKGRLVGGAVRLASECKPCQSLRSKVHREANLEEARRRAREHARLIKEKMRNYAKRRRAECGDHIRALEKAKRVRLRPRRREYEKRYYAANRERIREREKIWSKKKRAANPTFRLCENMSSGIWQSLKNGKQGRKWESLVGYTAAELIAHLEARFLPGMTWENYGKFGWHVDHIRPISSFSFASVDDPEFKKCWALENLRPLWWDDNIRKKDKFVP